MNAETGNVVMSPVSVLFALGMTTAGTSDGSKTQGELKKFLRFPELGSDDDEVHGTFSNILAGLRGYENNRETIWFYSSPCSEGVGTCVQTSGRIPRSC